jgi:CRP-like cAMP-binding protein
MPAEAAGSRALDLVLRLRRIPLFRALALESLQTLSLAATVQQLAPGEPLARAGEPCLRLVLVLDGELAAPGGGAVAPAQVELLGALALLAGQPLPQPVVARGPVQLLRIPGDALFDFLEADFGALLEVMRGAARLLLEAPVDTGGLAPRTAPPSGAAPLDLVERMLIVWRAFGLENISVTALTDMARTASQRVADGVHPLWRVGDVASELVLVVDGSVTLRPAAEALPVQVAGPEAVLGGLDLFAGTLRRYDALPSAGTVLLHLPAAGVLGMFEDHFDMAAGVLTSLSRSALGALSAGGTVPRD